MDRRLFSLMPESRFARLSASPHDKSRRRTSGGFHPLPFRLTSGEANHPPQTGRRKTKCRAGADPTQHNKTTASSWYAQRAAGMFFFRPFLSTQPGVSFHATAPRRDGEKDLPAHRRPAAVRRGIVNRRKLYVFSTKNGKRKVGLFPLKGKKPSCIRGEKTV